MLRGTAVEELSNLVDEGAQTLISAGLLADGGWGGAGDGNTYIVTRAGRNALAEGTVDQALRRLRRSPTPFPFKLLRTISDEHGWTGFRQPAWERRHGLPRITNLAQPAPTRNIHRHMPNQRPVQGTIAAQMAEGARHVPAAICRKIRECGYRRPGWC